MKQKTLRQLRKGTGLTAMGFANLLRLDGDYVDRTVRRWESGETPIPGYVELFCELLENVPGVKKYLDAEIEAGLHKYPGARPPHLQGV